MAKIEKHDNVRIGDPDVSFYCPGCKCDHGVWLHKNGYTGPAWEFNDDFEHPTFSPSIKVTSPFAGKMNVCHSFVTNGMIQYLPDCTHELAGKTIELSDID